MQKKRKLKNKRNKQNSKKKLKLNLPCNKKRQSRKECYCNKKNLREHKPNNQLNNRSLNKLKQKMIKREKELKPLDKKA